MTSTVLVVDDAPAVRALLTEVLTVAGYRVESAADGAAALELIGQTRPHLIITDLRMPRLDGLGLVGALQAIGLSAIPTLVISAEPRPESVPAERFLSKPLDLDLLLRTVQSALAAAAEAGDAPPPARPVVLVVEDEPAMRDVLREVLTARGYVVELAVDGPAGLARLAAGDVDVVLLDLMLPGMDGLEFCLRVRAHEQAVYVPIVILTAASGEAQRHAGFAAGADDYVAKPFTVEELLDRLQVWVQVRRRLRLAHNRLRREVAGRAQDDAVVVMARTAGRELGEPLAALRAALAQEKAQAVPGDEPWLAALETAIDDLAARVAALAGAIRFATTEQAELRFLDLNRAQDAESSVPG
jgi:CheY-like chemotaxis protein